MNGGNMFETKKVYFKGMGSKPKQVEYFGNSGWGICTGFAFEDMRSELGTVMMTPINSRNRLTTGNFVKLPDSPEALAAIGNLFLELAETLKEEEKLKSRLAYIQGYSSSPLYKPR